MFFTRLSLADLIELCRVLRHYLASGLTVVDVFRQQAKRGPAAVRPIAARISAALETGSTLEQALKRETAHFPPLFLSLGAVGERTGMLPEVYGELEKYFLRQQKLRREFFARIAWPVVQFVMATVVLALLIAVLGMLGSQTPNGKPFDPLGLGLFGPSGAATFLGVIYGTIAGLFAVYLLADKLFGGRAKVDRLLLSVPALGPCLRALALGRFCLALRLTHESGMSIGKALRLSMRATGNSAYADAEDVVTDTVAAGDDVALALSRTGLFPEELVRVVEVAEEAGTLSEVMKHEGDEYHDEAGRRLAVLTSVAGYGIWMMIGVFITIAIFRIYGSYLGMIDEVLPR
ncbi:MAG: type II secretion system F family protein [Gemmataceae bacterium]